jgi:hypothetical protein
MIKKYKYWINQNGYDKKENAKNKCNEAVRKMHAAFPELTIQVGYAGFEYHCWLKDEYNNIIDPTVAQFNESIMVIYTVVADRFLHKDEIELSAGAIFLRSDDE